MDVNQYLEIFLDETKEHLDSLNTQILNLEQEPEDEDTINEIFRAAHSLKGMAGTMGYKRMQALTHDMENVFSEIRNGTMKVTSNLIDTLFQCLDALEEYTNNIQETADEGTNDNQQLIGQLNEYLQNSTGKQAEKAKGAPEKAVEKSGESSGEKPAGTTDGNAQGEDVSEEKWLDIVLDESERTVLSTAQSQGKNIYGVTVYIQESCLLKAARAFLVYKAIEEKAEIIVCDPPAQDIEDEKFDLEFSLIIISDYTLDEIFKDARNVSEVEKVIGAPYDLDGREEKAASEEEEETKPSVTLPQPQQNTPAKGSDKKSAGKPVANRTVRVDIEKLDNLMNLVSELIIAKNSMVADSRTEGSSGLREHIEYLESVTTNLHESVMKVRMVPIESVVAKFPRMIRDLSKNLNKKMELYMSGEETELDRTVVDEIGDPLMHLLRNSADHGLEPAEVRIKRGKPEVGSIFLNAYQDGNNVVIEVGDDGNGIDVEAVKEKAIERGVVTPDQASMMSEKDIINLLFHAGFSTAKEITDVSGRGVGLDVVKSKIESLSGEVEVKSKLGEGSTWTIRLPLTLAIIQALMVIVGGEKYAIALGSIQTIEDISPSQIKLVQNREVINLRGNVIPIIRLSDELDVESSKSPDENIIVVIVKKGESLAGLVIDELMGQQEIVIKSLGKYISKCRIISGATILGDGEVALILDANALI